MDILQRRFLIAKLRRVSSHWPAVSEARRRAKCRVCSKRLCASHSDPKDCSTHILMKDCQVDHRVPVIPVTGWDTADGFITRLLCTADELDVLCKPCHLAKTLGENVQRRLK
jgi:hypothetical protein